MTTPSTGKLLIVDDEHSARSALAELLRADGHDVRQASDGCKALGVLKDFTPDVLLTDLKMPFMDGLELLTKVQETHPDISCIVMTAFASIENAVEAMHRGADDYLTKPLNFDAVELVIQRALERQTLLRELQTLRQLQPTHHTVQIIGQSEPLRQVIQLTERVAPSRATVLVTGESGTGKELIARLLHDASNRADAPFVPLHCAALPESLLESELFGHEKGSFTGATSQRVGKLEEGHTGTVFLDEIGDISPAIQVKLLRFLQTNIIERVGSNKSLELDVRIVAATNKNLVEEIQQGRFREDLFYRLNVINIESPPLRHRRDDILLLARHFITKYAAQNNRKIEDVSPEFFQALHAHDWPGNVRELENIIERAVVLTMTSRLDTSHLPDVLGYTTRNTSLSEHIQIPGTSLAEIEKFAILQTYESTGGDTRQTADILGISQRKVQYKLREYSEAEAS